MNNKQAKAKMWKQASLWRKIGLVFWNLIYKVFPPKE